MAVEDNLDQLYALYVANTIMTARLWAHMADLAAMISKIPREEFLEKQKRQCFESISLWPLAGHHNPETLKKLARDAVDDAFSGIIRPPSGQRSH